MKNEVVARVFREIALMLELKGDNPFRIRAYERAAQNIESLGQDLEAIIEEDSLINTPGIGSDLASKIKEIAETGKLKYHQDLKRELPSGLLEMLKVPGLGPKTVRKIYEELKISSIEKLEEAAKKGKLRSIEGIREKTEENILRGIGLIRKGTQRTPLYFVLRVAARFVDELKKMKEVKKIEVAGSLRRKKDTIRDIDILIVSTKPSSVMEKFTQLPIVKEVLSRGKTKSSVISKENNIQVDLRVVNKNAFGSALMYFTGSKEFNIKMRQLAIKKGLKVNEYGVFSTLKNKEHWLAGKTEEEIFSLFKMAYIPPGLREDRGEVEAALEDKLPEPLKLADIKGDFHVHSYYSDGYARIDEIANKAEELGYSYIAVCDHSQGLKVAHGLGKKEVYKKIEEIRKVNAKSKVRVLCGTEVDIDSSGNLDYPEDVLKEFDVVVAAIHSGFKQPKEQLTKRIVCACKNKYVNIIAHPTGRLWGMREPYQIQLDQVLSAARDFRVALEINCYPQRLDLNDLDAMQAKKMGVKISLGTDAHKIEQLAAMELGISVATRGWLEKKDVINCLSVKELLKWLKK